MNPNITPLRSNNANIGRALWLLTALLFPSFAVSFLRVNVGNLHLPYPSMSLALICAGAILYLLMRGGRFKRMAYLSRYQTVAIMCALFFIWHLVSLLLYEGRNFDGLKEIIKLATGLVMFGAILVFFPREPAFMERFWRVVLGASVALLIYLNYRSLEARNLFLSSLNVDNVTFTGGRNQVAWYVAAVLQFAFLRILVPGQRLRAFLPLAIILFSLMYLASRAGWLSAGLGLATATILAWRNDRAEGAKILLVVLAIAFVIAMGGMWVLDTYAGLNEVAKKFVWIYNPEAVPELHSYEVRWGRVEEAWDGFMTAPITGVGLQHESYGGTHNDYAGILAQLGAVGELLFLGILAFVGKRCLWKPEPFRRSAWISLASRGAYVSIVVSLAFLHNLYTTPFFWFLLAMVLVAVEVEKTANCPSASPGTA